MDLNLILKYYLKSFQIKNSLKIIFFSNIYKTTILGHIENNLDYLNEEVIKPRVYSQEKIENFKKKQCQMLKN